VNSFGNNVIFRYDIDGALPTNTIPTKQGFPVCPVEGNRSARARRR
jgi:hypothetical protein